MAPDSVTASTDNGTDALLQSLVRGKRGEALRAQLTARYPEIWAEEIEEAIQYATVLTGNGPGALRQGQQIR